MAGSGGESTCLIDCSIIATDQCHEGSCNEQTGDCQIVAIANGTPCDDDTFCTIDDECDDGACIGAEENDCGLVAGACEEIACVEASQSCSLQAQPDGASCALADLCTIDAACTDGSCIGSPVDCTGEPVPDVCHVSQCNPNTGDCEPVAGNDGAPCDDPNDLCEVAGNCSGGSCANTQSVSCSHLTQDCVVGVCDSQTGQCTTQNAVDGDGCDDLDLCTTGDGCQGGQCTGGTAVTDCIHADGCCPPGCHENDDDDCACGPNLAPSATPSSSGGGNNSTGYGPANWNDGVDEAACEAAGCFQCHGWIDSSTTPTGSWMQYEWPSAVQIGSLYVDASQCTGSTCNSGLTLYGGEIQYFSGDSWITAHSFTGNDGDLSVTFNPKLTTSRLRIYNVTAADCPQNFNTLAYEWYVWTGPACQP